MIVLGYFYFLLYYTSTLLHFGGKYCTFFFTGEAPCTPPPHNPQQCLLWTPSGLWQPQSPGT